MTVTATTIRKGYVETGQGQIHYRASGLGTLSGAPVLFFHRTPVCSASFEPVMRQLADWRPLVAFDTPGFGESFTPPADARLPDFVTAFAAAIAGLGIDRYHLVGHHTGAHFAAELASLPGALSLMVDGAMIASASERGQATPPNPDPVIDRDGGYARSIWAFLQPFYTVFDPRCVHDEFVGALRSTFTRSACMNVVRSHDMLAALQRAGCPVLASAASDDVFVAHLDRAAAVRPAVRIHRYGAAGIASPELQTAAFCALVRDSCAAAAEST